MHRRLRRQLDEALGQVEESPPHLRKLFRKIDKEYRRADDDRASLQRALALLSELLRRQPQTERRRSPSPQTRAVARLLIRRPSRSRSATEIGRSPPGTARPSSSSASRSRKRSAASCRCSSFPIPMPPGQKRAFEFSGRCWRAAEPSSWCAIRRRERGHPACASGRWSRCTTRTAPKWGARRWCSRAISSPDRRALAWEGTGDGIWDWDVAADRLWLSDSWRAIVGAKETLDAPSAWLDRVHPGDREAVQAAITAHLEGRSQRFDSEHRLRHEDGSWRWVLRAARPFATRRARRCGSPVP